MPRWRDLARIGAVVAIAAAAIALLVTGREERRQVRAAAIEPAGWRGLVPGPRSPVSVGQRVLVVLRAPSLADRVARAGGVAGDSDERRWTAAAFAAQRQLVASVATSGVIIRPEFSYARVLNGFSAALDPRGIALLERRDEVAGVYPVRAAYPAGVSRTLVPIAGGLATTRVPELALPGFDGRGLTIALLDTGVDRSQPYLRGRVAPGYDIVDGDDDPAAKRKPGDPSELERHGTEMAGILAGRPLPTGLAGVAPGATVLPIRVAGWQRDATGDWVVYGRTDQVIAGLERAVDPNGDGAAHDAVRVALVPLSEPYAAFADSPSARAVAGALRLDTLVVAPAGNDGPAGPGYGSISGPGGAPAALTVGAADLRRSTEDLRVVLRTGLAVPLDADLPLVGAVRPERELRLDVVAPFATARRGAPASPALSDLFDGRGLSRVAGKAALLPVGSSPALVSQLASRAGAAAVLLYGDAVPPGGGGLDASVSIPVTSLPPGAARMLIAALRRGDAAAVTLGAPGRRRNGMAERVADFSSRGLSFDGRLKPDVSAPGVAVLTGEPGGNADGSPSFGTINGSSAAAAAVAGAAALLAQARPSLHGTALKSLLTGSARRLRRDGVTAQGAGLVDLGKAVAAEYTVTPATLALGPVDGRDWYGTERFTVRNLSTRTLRLRLTTERVGPAANGVSFVALPDRLVVRPGQSRSTTVTAHVTRLPARAGAAEGSIRIWTSGSVPFHVPWTVTRATTKPSLVGAMELSSRSFEPSDTEPAVLALRLGRIARSERGDEVRPLGRLDVELWTAAGERRGLLTRLRNLLPGSYALGITGRGPAGRRLRPGAYRLRLVAYPTDGTPASERRLRFSIR